MRKRCWSALLWATLACALAQGGEWVVIGPRAMGMGGAGVAVTRGPHATYWNPANLGILWPSSDERATEFGVSIPVSVSASARGDVLKTVDEIYGEVEDIDWDSVEDVFNSGEQFNVTSAHQDQLQTLLRVVTEDLPKLDGDGKGVEVDAGGELDIQFGRFALSGRGIGWSAASPLVDLSASSLVFGTDLSDFLDTSTSRTLTGDALSLANSLDDAHLDDYVDELVHWTEQAGVDLSDPKVEEVLDNILSGTDSGGTLSDNFISNNESGVSTRGLGVTEVGLSYAHPFLEGKLALGTTGKAMYGMTLSKDFHLKDLEDGSEVLEELTEDNNREESLRFGVDAGATFLPTDFLAVGVVGRNLNQPRFEAEGSDYELDPQVRAGVAVFPSDWLTLACDADVYKNSSEVLPGYKSQRIGGGAELSLGDILFIRGGLSKNIATGEGLTYHAGLGLHGGPLHLDVAAAMSSEKESIETDGSDEEIPERGGLSVMLELVMTF